MKVLITGLSGFVGTNLLEFLNKSSKKFFVVGVSRYSENPKNNGICIETKITYENLFSDNSYVHHSYIHLAGKAHVINEDICKEEFFKANTELTKNVFNKFLSDNYAKNFIFISTIAAVSTKSITPLLEDANTFPNGYYGLSKREAEIYILDNLPADKNKKVYIIRPPMIHGPGNKGNLNLLFDIVTKGIPWPLGKFDNKRSFLSIDNLCFAINELLQKDIPSGIYHLADDEPVSTNEIVKMISGVLQKNPRIWNIPKSIIFHIAKVGNFLPLPLNKDRLNKLTEDFLVSNEKFVKAIGKPLPLSSKKGLMKTIKSFIQ